MVKPSFSKPSYLQVFKNVPKKVKWLIYLISFQTLGFGFFIVVVAAYLPEIGLGSGAVGLILGVSGLIFVVSAIPLGMVSDSRGRKWILILGNLGLTPTLLIIAFTHDIVYLVLAGLIAGVSEGAFMSSWNAMIADQTTLENRDAAFSLSFIITTVTMGLGFAVPILFPPLISLTNIDSITIHQYALIFFALLGLISPISLLFLLRDYKEVRHPGRLFLKGKSTKMLLKFSGINGLIGLGAGFIIPLIPTWLFLEFGIFDAVSGPLIAVASLTIGFAAIGSAGLAKKYGHIRAIVLTQGLSMGFMLAIAFIPSVLVIGVFYVIRTALMNMSVPIADSYLMSIITREERGLASAINSIGWRLPNSVSTIGGGLLLEAGFYDLPFVIATAFYITSIMLLFIVFKDVKPRGD